MRLFNIFNIRLLIISAAFFVPAAPAQAGTDYSDKTAPAYGDTIVVGSIADASSLIPVLASDSASADICGLIYNGLIKYDKDLNIIGDLAESWEIKDSGKTVIFRLRKGVLWHDKKPLSASDVEFTYKKLIDPAVRTPYSGDFLKIESLETPDPYTVIVRYKEPFAPALSSWGMSIMPRHILENEDLNTTRYSRSPIGSGPYKFRIWKSDEKIELVANENYFEGRPCIDRFIYRIIPDNATMFLELQAQGIDMMGLSPLQYRRQTEDAVFKGRFNKYRYPSFGYTYLAYNLKDRIFSDAIVRKALDMAVDKSQLIDGVLLGMGRPCTGPFVQESWAYNSMVIPNPFDPGQAKKLLKEAGWSDTNKDGILDKDGKPFEFTIVTNNGSDERRRAAEIIQQALSKIGIRVKIKLLEWSVFIKECINKKSFEAVLLGWSLSRDPDCYDIWHSSKTKEGEFNFISYSNPEVDELLEKARRDFDADKRKECYHKIHSIIYNEQPYMFLWVADALPAVHKRFKGIEPSASGIWHNFIRWYVPKDEQRYK